MEHELKIKPLKEWGIPGLEDKLFIAGPCSAETENQIIETAKGIKNGKVVAYRAGIWKPRTRPGSFEGVGSIGLPWLKRVKDETGLLIATEVANVKHIYDVLKAGVDILWVGARTTVNPFATQEIADALQGVDIPVMVKNPVNPDLELWIGAIERLNKAGITRLAALHRGFSNYEKSPYRNEPYWQIPIELKRRYNDLPIICDPSHIAGNRKLIRDISQKSIDLNFDGLMIETHHNPDEAWSDAKQQITPERLHQILNSLIMRKPNADDTKFMKTLEELRVEIDRLDTEALKIFEDRMEVAKEIGRTKKANNVTILQTTRWDTILKKSIEKGTQKGLSEEFITKVFKAIHQESINNQIKIMND